MRSRIGLAALVLVAMLTSASASGAARHGWARSGLAAVAQPAPAGDAIVLYAHTGTSLRVVALRVRDGSTAWTAAASPSSITAGVSASLAVRDDVVFFLGPDAAHAGGARVVARDGTTGKPVWLSEPGSFFTWPEICPDQTTAVCINGAMSRGPGQYRFDASTGKLLRLVRMGAAASPGRELGPDIFDPGGRNPEQFIVVSNGGISWRRPVASIFSLPRASSDGGWSLERAGALYVGSIDVPPKINGNHATFDLAATMNAGFSVRDGSVRWRAPGEFACASFPCPGDEHHEYTAPALASLTGPSVGIRTIGHGVVHVTRGHQPAVPASASVGLEGFEPATGKTLWTYRAGRNVALLKEDAPARIDGTTIGFPSTDGGYTALDLATGAARPVARTTRAWCERLIDYRLSGGYYGGGTGEYEGGYALFPCTLDGRRAPLPATIPAFVAGIGASAGRMTAWTDTAGVVRATPA